MASPFLANLAIGYATQKNAQAEKAIEEQKAEQLDLRKRELDAKYETQKAKDIMDLAYQHEMAKTQTLMGQQIQSNAQFGRSLIEAASRSTDPYERAQLQRTGEAFSNAGAMKPEEIVNTMKMARPPATEAKAALDLQDRSRYDAAMASLETVDKEQLANNPDIYQHVVANYGKGLSPAYRKVFKENIDEIQGMYKHAQNPDMPADVKVLLAQYHSLDLQKKGALIKQELTPEEASQQYDPQLNGMADRINEWSQQVNKEDLVEHFEPVTMTTERGPVGKFFGLEPKTETKIVATKKQKRTAEVPTQTTAQGKFTPAAQQRAMALIKQNPSATYEQVKAQLSKEGLL